MRGAQFSATLNSTKCFLWPLTIGSRPLQGLCWKRAQEPGAPVRHHTTLVTCVQRS